MRKKVSEMRKKWMKQPKYRQAYEARGGVCLGFRADRRAQARRSRTRRTGMKMGTTQLVVARRECGRGRPSMPTLERLAEATCSRLLLPLEPRAAKRRTA